ncbi:hypothetical protein FACS189483_04820 [Spirochaetia bacterium]|nr:hypothetical protein FACS189483_04820 [Spirochaetia bacterium]
MTSKEDGKIARDYVLKHELSHPKTSIFNALVFLSLLLLVCFSIAKTLGLIFAEIPFKLVFFLVFFSILFILSKNIIIGIIEIYQHYAPEGVHRNCLCMPTCSEYMILVIKKYGALKGMWMGIYRLLHTCRGRDYKIDYP